VRGGIRILKEGEKNGETWRLKKEKKSVHASPREVNSWRSEREEGSWTGGKGDTLGQ